MNKDRKKKAVILVVIAAIVIAALLVALLLPSMTRSPLQNSGMISEYKESETALKSPSSYKDLFQTIQKHKRSTASSDGAQNGAPLQFLPNTDTTNALSDTGTRAGAASASDAVKTDGRYLYSVFTETGTVTILDTKDKLELVYKGTIVPDETYRLRDFYVTGNTLYLTGSKEPEDFSPAAQDSSSFLLTFDISDRHLPVLTNTYEQSGQYLTSRLTYTTFYLFTNYYNYEPDENSVPLFSGTKIACEDIYYGKYFDQANYYCVGAVALQTPDICTNSKAVLSTSSEFFISDTSIFVISSDWIETNERNYCATDIVSIAYDGTSLTGTALGYVSGFINDSYSIDAYNGSLRLFTTQKETTLKNSAAKEASIGSGYTQSSTLWLLDEQLHQCSSLPNIQERGDFQSARFFCDTVYFIPNNGGNLMGADLSDPNNPIILDDSGLTGFSDYLQSWSDDRLFGLVHETDASGAPDGIRLSMYDTRDPSKVTETDSLVFGDPSIVPGTDYSDNALLIDPANSLIGFAAQTHRYDANLKFDGNIGAYYVFSYDSKTGFKPRAQVLLYEDNYWLDYIEDAENRGSAETADGLPYQYLSIHNVKGLTIGGNLYIFHPEVAVYQYDTDQFQLQNMIDLYSAE